MAGLASLTNQFAIHVRAPSELALGEVAIHAKHLIAAWETFFLEPGVHAPPANLPSMFPSSSVNVIDREKLNLGLPTAGAIEPAIAAEHFSFQALLFLSRSTSHHRRMNFAVGLVAFLNRLLASPIVAESGVHLPRPAITVALTRNTQMDLAEGFTIRNEGATLGAGSGRPSHLVPAHAFIAMQSTKTLSICWLAAACAESTRTSRLVDSLLLRVLDLWRPHATSVQSLAQRKRPPAGLIVVDEAHHVTARGFTNVLAAYPDAAVVGLSS